MSATSINAKQQFEELITSLCNSWVSMKIIEHDYNPEILLPEVNKFFNMPLHALYNLVAKDLITAYNETASPLLAKDVVVKYLQSRINEIREERQNESFNRDPVIPDDIAEKTDLRKWIQEKYTGQKQMSVRLFNILHTNSRQLNYLEYIDRESFFRCRNAGEKAWQEFVKLRGY